MTEYQARELAREALRIEDGSAEDAKLLIEDTMPAGAARTLVLWWIDREQEGDS